jgi:hypothetical protein
VEAATENRIGRRSVDQSRRDFRHAALAAQMGIQSPRGSGSRRMRRGAQGAPSAETAAAAATCPKPPPACS